jgi:hypothetical protein
MEREGWHSNSNVTSLATRPRSEQDFGGGEMFRSGGKFICIDLIIVGMMTAVLLILMASRTAFIGRTQEFVAILWVWTLHSLVAAVTAAPIVYIGRGRAHWNPLDLLALVVPFFLWLLLMKLSLESKSLGNLVEPLVLSLGVPVAALARVIIGPHARDRWSSMGFVGILCAAAVCVYFCTPSLPE